jgi:hypothetical protein
MNTEHRTITTTMNTEQKTTQNKQQRITTTTNYHTNNTQNAENGTYITIKRLNVHINKKN